MLLIKYVRAISDLVILLIIIVSLIVYSIREGRRKR